MSPFLSAQDRERIERAIAASELRTSGEIRVMIHQALIDNPVEAAASEFARLGMHRTRHRNAILILVAPASHTFAIYGDMGIHAHCGESFWREVAAAMESHFRHGAFAEGLSLAIERAGELLAHDFPRSPHDINELPNTVVDPGIVI